MTKPTGRPRGRPKTKEYVTLMARVPLDLAAQVHRYAGRKRQPISEVLREGLQLLLDEEDTASRYVYDRKRAPGKMSDRKEGSAHTLDAPQARQPGNLSDTNEDTLALDTSQPVLVSDRKEDIPDILPDIDDTLDAIEIEHEPMWHAPAPPLGMTRCTQPDHPPYPKNKRCKICQRIRKQASRAKKKEERKVQ